MSPVVKVSGTKVTEVAMHTLLKLPEEMAEEITAAGSLERKRRLSQLLTMFLQTPRLVSTEEVPDNPPTTEIMATQHQMPGALDLSSLTPTLVLDNGGKFNSTKITGSVKSESLTEETVAEEDLAEPRSMLTTKFVVKSKTEPETDNGMTSLALNHSGVRK
jgi:hypothetical protein